MSAYRMGGLVILLMFLGWVVWAAVKTSRGSLPEPGRGAFSAVYIGIMLTLAAWLLWGMWIVLFGGR